MAPLALTGAQGPTIRRSSLMRYKTLWEGSNQTEADGLLSLERMMWEQAQPEHATVGASVFRESDPRGEPEADAELEAMAHQFRRLQTEIRDTLEDNAGPRPLLPRDAEDAESAPPSPELELRPPALEPKRTLEDIGREFAGLRDSLHGCAQPTKPSLLPTPGRRPLASLAESPSSIPVPRRAPGFASELKPRLPSGGGACRPPPPAESSSPLPRPVLGRGAEPRLHGAASVQAAPAELGNLAVCSRAHSRPSPSPTSNLHPNAMLNRKPSLKPEQELGLYCPCTTPHRNAACAASSVSSRRRTRAARLPRWARARRRARRRGCRRRRAQRSARSRPRLRPRLCCRASARPTKASDQLPP